MYKKIFWIIKLVIIINLLMLLIRGRVIASFICLFNVGCLIISDYGKEKLGMSNLFNLFIYIFLTGSLLLGEVYHFYAKIWYFDLLLHFLSSFIISGFAVYIIKFLKGNMCMYLSLIFIFSVSMMASAMWEITEFTIDNLFEANMQKDTIVGYINTDLLSSSNDPIKVEVEEMKINNNILINGYIDIGLNDTIYDMIAALCGSMIFIIVYRKRSFLV